MFSNLMAMFNAEMALRSFCRWGLSAMVEMQGEHEEAVRKNPIPNKYERPLAIARAGPFGELTVKG